VQISIATLFALGMGSYDKPRETFASKGAVGPLEAPETRIDASLGLDSVEASDITRQE
jgi:hypothetical protein